MELLRQVDLRAPELVRAHPLIAGRRVLKLADRCAAEQRADQLDDSPLLPNHLSLDQCGVHALVWVPVRAGAYTLKNAKGRRRDVQT